MRAVDMIARRTPRPGGAGSARRARLVAALARILPLLLVCLFASGCAVEDKRIRDLLVSKGFGSRSEGDATVENYVVGGDAVVFLVDPSVLLQPAASLLSLLSQPQPVGLDGRILVPYVGRIYVLGTTEDELSRLVSEELQTRFTFETRVQARIVSTGKVVYAFGEFQPGGKGRIPFFEPEMTILDFVAQNFPSPLANLGRVRVIRPDAEHPLVVRVNLREMILTGNTTYNILLRDNDIIYIPPTFFGHLARFLQRLLQPLAFVTQAVFGVVTTTAGIQFLTGQGGGNPFFFQGGRGGGGFRGF
jgi:protein involved in polysaccharide export with SLBB domain